MRQWWESESSLPRTATARTLLALALLAAISAPSAHAQWELQDSGTKASLRGVHYIGGGVVWASGTDGTVLRSEDSGYVWQGCAIPPGAEHLDFRAVQAFDENTALVMSSGPGDQSRLYKTTDGCRSWKLLFTNPDKDGFWDALNLFIPSTSSMLGHPLNPSFVSGYILGDPVGGSFQLFVTHDGGATWERRAASKRVGGGCQIDSFPAKTGEAAFAASNQSLLDVRGFFALFVTGGVRATVRNTMLFSLDGALCHESTHSRNLPIAHGNGSSGAFAFAIAPESQVQNFPEKMMIVGGDYKLPNATSHNAVFVTQVGTIFATFREPNIAPHGYRSSVAYDPTYKAWITVGPNGTDISTDDGRNCHPLTPGPEDQPGSDRDWNALSLPFVVGPHGRIGRLRASALPPVAPANSNP